MKEIKFRIWDTHKKVMNRVNYINFAYGIVGLSNENVKYYEQSIHRVKFMQYTGLKDKNGVEIYEGDICEELYEEILGVVKFSEGKFIIVWDNSGDDLFEVSDEVRVVGNIYEHGYFVRGVS